MQEEQNINKNVDELGGNEINYYDHYYSRPPLGKGQKIAVAALAFFSLFIVIAWMIQFRQSISGSLNNQSASGNNATESGAFDANKDTDGDGLTDYDEINTYKTSPFLEDSDSDGFDDGKEVDSDKDPNCPTGVDCTGANAILNPSTVTDVGGQSVSNPVQATINSNVATTSNQKALSVPETAAGNTADLQKVLTGQVDAQTLRKTLLDSGMDKAVLDKITDDVLMASYKETLNK